MVKTACLICKKKSKDYPDLSFHRFPKHEKNRKIWLERLKLNNFDPSQFKVICSDHFKKDNIITLGKKRFLRSGCFPSINSEDLKEDTKDSLDIKKEDPEIVSCINNSTILRDTAESSTTCDTEHSLNEICTEKIDQIEIVVNISKENTSDDKVDTSDYNSHTYPEIEYRKFDHNYSKLSTINNIDYKKKYEALKKRVEKLEMSQKVLKQRIQQRSKILMSKINHLTHINKQYKRFIWKIVIEKQLK